MPQVNYDHTFSAWDDPDVTHGCLGKARYPSKRHAQSVANKIQRRGQAGATMNAYHCKGICGKWHIGHPKRNGKTTKPEHMR